MNDPKDQPIDADDQRKWFKEHKAATGLSWAQLAPRLGAGVNKSSLGLWVNGKYNAPGDKIAEAIFRYRQTLAAQAAIKGETPTIPTFFRTETTDQLLQLFTWAQRGRITAAPLGPGLGKTEAAKHYRACNTNVFYTIFSPSTASVTSLMIEVLRSLGVPKARGTNQTLSRMIKDHVGDLGNALLILDETQHLSEKAFDEIRSWHDATGVGIALLGDVNLLQKLEGGSRDSKFAQIFSRISLKIPPRNFPLTADVEALLEAWDLQDPKVCELVHSIAQKPGALRGATFTLELAHMLAAAGPGELTVGHVQDAWAQLSSRAVAA